METKKLFEDFNRFVSGSRLASKELIPDPKKEILPDSVCESLQAQWSYAGRGGAKVIAKIDEADGKSLYLTGWDGDKTFTGCDSDGVFGYIPSDRVEGGKLDETFPNDKKLEDLRKNLHEMDKHHVEEAMAKLKKQVMKRGKGRRHSELTHAAKKLGLHYKDAGRAPDALWKTAGSSTTPLHTAMQKFKKAK